MCGYLNFALREWDFVPDVHKKVHILLPLACDLNLVITSEASRIIRISIQRKELKKQWRVEIVAYAQPFRPRVLTEDTRQQSFAYIMTKKVYLRMFCKSLVKR